MSAGEEKLTFKMFADAMAEFLLPPTNDNTLYLHPNHWKDPQERAELIDLITRYTLTDAIRLYAYMGNQHPRVPDGDVWTRKDGILYPKEENESS